MSDPSSFYSFADYLGLNNEAGQQMLDKSMAQGDKLKAGVEAASEAQAKVARSGGSSADFNAAGQEVRSTLGSYADWAKGMTDPKARQALMEKTYGKGNVSWIDSAVSGASSDAAQRLLAGAADADRLDAQIGARSSRMSERMTMDAESKTAAAGDVTRRAGLLEGQNKMLAARSVDDENRRVDNWARTVDPNYSPDALGDTGAKDYWGGQNAKTSQRDIARRGLAKWEGGELSLGKRRWISAGSGGGRWDDHGAGGAFDYSKTGPNKK